MLFTRVWSVCLGLGVAATIAVLLMVSHGLGGTFTGADQRVVRARTEAALIALQAELQAAAVRETVHVFDDERTRSSLVAEAKRVAAGEALPQRLSEVAESLRLRTRSDLTLAVIDRDTEVAAVNGVDEHHLAALFQQPSFAALAPDEQALSSVILNGNPFFAFVTQAAADGSRLAAIAPIPLHAGSLLRRALGTEHPAAIVRGDEILASFNVGTASKEQVLELLAKHLADVPEEGASRTFLVGEGLDARIGALGRVPGAAGLGERGALVVILSDHGVGASHGGIQELLHRGRARGLPWNAWLIVFAVGGVAIAIALLVSHLEVTEPARRLAHELHEMNEGRQHQLFYERYSGIIGRIAAATASLHETLRGAPSSARYLSVSTPIHLDESMSAPILLDLDDRSARAGMAAGSPITPPSAGPRRTSSPRPVTPPLATPPRLQPAPPLWSATAKTEPTPPVAAAISHGPPHLEDEVGEGLFAGLEVQTPPPARGTARARASAAPRPATARTPQNTPDLAWRELYEEFSQVKNDCGESLEGLSYDKFVRRLESNVATLRAERPELTDVRFAVYVKNGKAAIKAKVARELS